MSKFYLMTDLEGVAGVYEWEQRGDDSQVVFEQRMRQRRWLAGEVSAAAWGLAAGGAQDVIVNDGHGAGYTIDLDALDAGLALGGAHNLYPAFASGALPDPFAGIGLGDDLDDDLDDDDDDALDLDLLVPNVQVIHGLDRPFWLPYLDATCAATGIVGAHAKAETDGGCLYHTMSTNIRGYWLNGISVGEMGLQAAIAGHYGVPFVFCSGDAYACKEIQELIPGCVTVPVKTGLARKSAMTLTPGRACEAIREGAEEAMSRIGEVKPFKLDSPVLFREERVGPEFDCENPPPRSRVIDSHTREIEADDVIDLVQLLYGYPRDWKPLAS